MGLIECQLVGDDFFESDPDHLGWIRVRHLGKVRWSRPLLPFGEFRVPTKEWISKYAKPTDTGNAIGIYCDTVNNESRLVWVGFCIYKDQLPDDAMTNYAYRRVVFTENWIQYFDDKDDQNSFVIKHSDGTIFTLDRTKGSENITISDGVNNNSLVMDKDGVKINGEFVVLKPLVDWLDKFKATFVLGNMGVPAPFDTTTMSEFVATLPQPNKYLAKNQ